MKLPRPYIPLDVRLQVAERQLGRTWSINGQTRTEKLRLMLKQLFGDDPVHLDHDPALENRQKLYDGTTHVAYSPPANDPEFLIYRNAQDHKTKTFIRGDGAQRSDVSQRRYLNRVAANRKPKKKFKPRRAKRIRRIANASIPVRND
jgi:hypothetical protein